MKRIQQRIYFEANHIGEGKDWGNQWATGGTNLPAYISPSTLSDPTNTYEDGWDLDRCVKKPMNVAAGDYSSRGLYP